MLQRLLEHGVHIKRDKCKILAESIEYLGHRIDDKGLLATDEKLQAIVQDPPPKNVQELRFLGLINYYGRFIPNSADKLHPLNKLLTGMPSGYGLRNVVKVLIWPRRNLFQLKYSLIMTQL